jgi:hypothetical protein
MMQYIPKEDLIKKRATLFYKIITNKPAKGKTKSVAPTKSALAKMKTLSDLPKEIIKRISLNDLAPMLKFTLRSWIQVDKLNKELLSSNHNAIDFLSLPENKKYINYPQLSKNTNSKAVELLRERIIEESRMSEDEYNRTKNKIEWITVAKNPYLFDIFKENMDKIRRLNWDALWEAFSSNPKAINILLANKRHIDFEGLSENRSTRAIKFLRMSMNLENISWVHLSGNNSPYAVKLLEENYDKIVWEKLVGNTNRNAIKLLWKKWESEKYLKENDTDEYNRLRYYFDDSDDSSGDEYFPLIAWHGKICENKNAIGLLRNKIAEEKKMEKEDPEGYEELPDWEKVNWDILSGNPNAIKLLKENYKKINWKVLCGNISPDAIDLIKIRLLVKPSDIDWEVLSGSLNPRAIELLDANQDKIFWGAFSHNSTPRAIELLRKRVIFEKERDNYDGKSSNEKERIVSGIFGIEHEKPPSKYLRANAKKHGSEPAKIPKRVFEKRHVSAPAKISLSKLIPKITNITKLPNDLKRLIVGKLRDLTPVEKTNNNISWKGLSGNPSIFTIT